MATEGDRPEKPEKKLATEAAIFEAAIDAMFEHGYHGTSVRQIADRAGMSVANVYYYFPSKHDLLFRFMAGSAAQLQEQLDHLLAATPDDPRERFSAAVRLFVERHTISQPASFVANTELRALDDDARSVIIAGRNAIEEVFRRLVREGVDAGVFEVEHVSLTVRAILAMGSSVSSWYRPSGPLSGAEIADRYVELALRMMGAAPSPTAPRRRRTTSKTAPASHRSS